MAQKERIFMLDGRPSSQPWSKEEALSIKSPLYTGLIPCDRCKSNPTFYYTRSDICQSCAYQDRSFFFQRHFFGKEIPEKNDWVFYAPDSFKGENLCSYGPHVAVNCPDTGECLGCREETGKTNIEPTQQVVRNVGVDLSREEARAQGFKLYLGGTCGNDHLGWRYVSTDKCWHCERGVQTQGMLCSKEEAIRNKRPRYRTGELCSNGHRAWRSVSDDHCEECERPRPKIGRPAGEPKPPAPKRPVGRPKLPPKPPAPPKPRGRPKLPPKPPAPKRPVGRPPKPPVPKRPVGRPKLPPKPPAPPAPPKKRGAPVGANLSPDMRWAMANPDMVLSKADARMMGFTLYRTGRPCIHGHDGWRRADNGACCDCLRGK